MTIGYQSHLSTAVICSGFFIVVPGILGITSLPLHKYLCYFQRQASSLAEEADNKSFISDILHWIKLYLFTGYGESNLLSYRT